MKKLIMLFQNKKTFADFFVYVYTRYTYTRHKYVVVTIVNDNKNKIKKHITTCNMLSMYFFYYW
jgi:hypothetical protein